jgi:hypothetical protein
VGKIDVLKSWIVILKVLFRFHFHPFREPIFTPELEYLYLCAYFVFALVAYTHWALVVIRSFCSFLGINCLTIPHGKNATNGKPKAS